MEGFVIRGDIKILDENETGLKITGIYGSNVEPKGIFFCELDNSMKLIEKPKLVPFLNLNDSIKQTVTDVKICGIKKMLNDEILILTEDEFRAQQKFTISGGGPSGSMSVIISYEWQLQKNMVSCWLVNNKKELVRIFTNSKQQSRNLYESPYRETFIGTNTYFTDSLIYLTNVDNDLKINNYLAIVNSSVALDKINFTNRAINSKKINFLNSKKSGFIQSIDYFEKRDLFWGKDCIYIRKTDTKGRILIGTLEY
ncbi:MAG: hypothetical protein IT247_06000 [Bacteroidia bacterium]|nr:hypothetical protein [Bacteroidia bacterium]